MRRSFSLIVLGTGLMGACGQVAPPGSPDGDGGQNTGGGAPAGGGESSSGGASPSGGESSSGGSVGESGGSVGESGGSGSGGEDNASGGQGTGGDGTICPGIVPECEPHGFGCSERGESYTCSECGVIELQGTACVRLLASDKEMGTVCTVRGEKELKCAGGDEEWSPTLDYPLEVEEFPTAFRLADDTSSTGQPLAFCSIDEAGSIGCTEHDYLAFETNGLGGTDCTDVALSDIPVACTLCAGHLACEGGGLVDISIDDVMQVAISDLNAFWLTSAGEIYYGYQPDAPVLPGTYSFLFVDDNITPCGIRDDGDLVCGSWDEEGTTYELAGDFVRGSGVSSRTCVIGVDGTLTCVSLVEGAFEPIFSPPGSDFVEVAVSSTKSCALTRAGVVVCWNEEGLMDEFAAKLN